MGRSIPSPTRHIDREIRRIRRLARRYPMYREGLERLARILRRRRSIVYLLTDPEDVADLPYLVAASVLQGGEDGDGLDTQGIERPREG